jgi:hypothetical protein
MGRGCVGEGGASHPQRPLNPTPPPTPCCAQVTLLDPVRFPGAIKIFAREICRNDLLSFGRLHFFFPDRWGGLGW